MALDTAAKRFSMLRKATRGALLFLPDGTIDAADRKTILHLVTPTSAVDVTAPIISSPTFSDLQQTTVDLGVTTDEGNGTLYWFISASATAPSIADLKAGTGAVASGNQAVSGVGVQAVNNAGTLVADTLYYGHLLHADASVNNSNIVSTTQFRTAAIPDTTPDDDDFTSQLLLNISTSVDSNEITLTGMDAGASVSIDVGTMSVDGDAYSASTRAVIANGTIQIRLTTSASDLTAVVATITISGISFQFSATTGESAATLSLPVVTPSSTTASLQITTNRETGSLSWVITQSATQPSVVQIKAGLNHLGAAADANGLISVVTSGIQVDTANGLVAETIGYFMHSVHETLADSNRLSSSSFNTLAAGSGGSGPFAINIFGVEF